VLRGPLLTEAQKWFDLRSQDLSDRERKFISASRALRERLAREERERQEREIEGARKLAEEQKQRAELSERREQEQKEAVQKLAEAAEKLKVERAAAEQHARVAESQRRVAVSRQLLVQASALLNDRIDLALLLCLEAGRIEDTFEARSTLLSET
jgi:phage terminase small subunit